MTLAQFAMIFWHDLADRSWRNYYRSDCRLVA
nr:type I toxin-antitoxin system toxin Ldr family protein [Escherichia coli]